VPTSSLALGGSSPAHKTATSERGVPRLRQVLRTEVDASVTPMYDLIFRGQTRVGWARASQIVFSQHCTSCRTTGISEEKIAAIPHWSASDAFSDVERAVLAYTDALVYDGGRVADGVFAALRTHLADEEILELTDPVAVRDALG
jgi:alkylhydroperoxidase family enzyme